MTSAASANNLKSPRPTPLLALADSISALAETLQASGKKKSVRELQDIWHERLRAFWILHPEIYEILGDLFLRGGDNFLAAECSAEAMSRFPWRARPVYQRALALARLGAHSRALALIHEHASLLSSLPDHRPLLARLHKDAWKMSGRVEDLRAARDEYQCAAAEPRDDVYYPAVNAATLSVFLDDAPAAEKLGELVERDLAARGGASNYWELASLAEARLARGDLVGARDSYAAALATGPAPGTLATTRDQAVLLLEKLRLPIDSLREILGHSRVLCVTGHMPDGLNRPEPRFPASREESVARRLADAFQEIKPTHLVTAAAAGTDILALEAAFSSGMDTTVILPLPEADFLTTSVRSAGGNWEFRFRDALAKASRILGQAAPDDIHNPAIWGFANSLILGAALQMGQAARGDVVLLAVWDGKSGDGPGGTMDFVRQAILADVPVYTLHPLENGAAELLHPSSITASDNFNPSLDRILHALHLAADSSSTLRRIFGRPGLGEALAASFQSSQLGAQARFLFRHQHELMKAALALASLPGEDAFGAAAASLPLTTLPSAAHGEAPGFADLAHMAVDALATRSVFFSWESAALAALLAPGDRVQSATFSLEFAGNREFSSSRRSPIYHLAVN